MPVAQQCRGHLDTGARCRHRTAQGDWCPQHVSQVVAPAPGPQPASDPHLPILYRWDDDNAWCRIEYGANRAPRCGTHDTEEWRAAAAMGAESECVLSAPFGYRMAYVVSKNLHNREFRASDCQFGPTRDLAIWAKSGDLDALRYLVTGLFGEGAPLRERVSQAADVSLYGMVEAILRNSNLDQDTLLRCVQGAIQCADPVPQVLGTALRHPRAGKPVLQWAWDNYDQLPPKGKEALARNRRTPKAILGQLAHDPNRGVQHAVLVNPAAPAEVLADILKGSVLDPDAPTWAAKAARRGAEGRLRSLTEASQFKFEEVSLGIMQDGSLRDSNGGAHSQETLRALQQAECPQQVLTHYALHGKGKHRLAALQNPNISVHTLVDAFAAIRSTPSLNFARSPVSRMGLVEAILRNPNVPAVVAEQVVTSSMSAEMRALALAHPRCSPDIVNRMARSSNAQVRAAAQAAKHKRLI